MSHNTLLQNGVRTYTININNIDYKNMDFHQAIKEYLDWKSSYAPRAAKLYGLQLHRFFIFTGKRLGELSLKDVVDFQSHLVKKFSQTTVAYNLMIIRNFCEYWAMQGQTTINPKYIRIPRYTQKAHQALSESEFLLMDQIVGESELQELTLRTIIRFLWDTGVRVSELCDIDLQDLDLENRNAKVITKKSRVLRWVFWTKETHQTLIKYLGVRLCLNSSDALFIAKRHNARERVTTRTVQRWIAGLCKQAGIERKITPHSFRHGKAHRILQKGGTVADIAKILGHSDKNPVAAFNYLKLSKREIEERANLYL